MAISLLNTYTYTRYYNTTHWVTLPPVADRTIGDLEIVIVRGAESGTNFTLNRTGYTVVKDWSYNQVICYRFYTADNIDYLTTCKFTSSNARSSIGLCLHYSGAADVESAADTGNGLTYSTAPNSPGVTPSWGASVDTLFLTIFGSRSAYTPTPPSNYAQVSGSPATYSDTQIAVATRTLATGAEEDPPAWSTIGTVGWGAATLALKTAGGGVITPDIYSAQPVIAGL